MYYTVLCRPVEIWAWSRTRFWRWSVTVSLAISSELQEKYVISVYCSYLLTVISIESIHSRRQQQHTTGWPVEKIHHTWSFGSDATVLDDYVLTTTIQEVSGLAQFTTVDVYHILLFLMHWPAFLENLWISCRKIIVLHLPAASFPCTNIFLIICKFESF